MRNFEHYINNSPESNMQEELTMKIGDLVPDKTVNLEELTNHSVERLQHLYRLMVENEHLELACVDQMALYFRFVRCGHEYYLPWQNVVSDVKGMIEDNSLKVRCSFCSDESVPVKPTANEEKEEMKESDAARTENTNETKANSTKSKLKASDFEKAERLQFLFLEPDALNKLPETKKKNVLKLKGRIDIRLSAYKKACAEKNERQVRNAGIALKNGLNYMRREHKVKCAVKLMD